MEKEGSRESILLYPEESSYGSSSTRDNTWNRKYIGKSSRRSLCRESSVVTLDVGYGGISWGSVDWSYPSRSKNYLWKFSFKVSFDLIRSSFGEFRVGVFGIS